MSLGLSPTELGSTHDDLQPGMVAILGLPFDEYSSFMAGAALAPRRIREVLHSGESNLSAETGIDLGSEPRLRDLGENLVESFL